MIDFVRSRDGYKGLSRVDIRQDYLRFVVPSPTDGFRSYQLGLHHTATKQEIVEPHTRKKRLAFPLSKEQVMWLCVCALGSAGVVISSASRQYRSVMGP